MKKIVLGTLLAFGASTLLAGCGLLPPIALTNPLGLDGKTLAVTLDATGSTPITTRVAGVGTANLTSTFEDSASVPVAPSKIDLAVELKSLTISAGCNAAVGLTSLKVSLTNFKLDLSDGAGATLRNFGVTLTNADFTVNPSGGTVINLPAVAATFNFVVNNVQVVKDILTTLPTPNTVKVSTSIATNPPLAGCTITFTFGAGSGSITL